MDWKELKRILFSDDSLDQKKCLRLHGIIGGICLLASLGVFIILKVQPPKFTIPEELVYVQFIVGVLLAPAWIFKASDHSIGRLLLVLHGLLFLVLVPIYTWYFYYVIYLGAGGISFLSGKNTGYRRMAHVPGILALISAYGTRLCLDFIPIKVKRKPVIILLLVIGGICDLIVMYAFIQIARDLFHSF
jgi:hypothetical protein